MAIAGMAKGDGRISVTSVEIRGRVMYIVKPARMKITFDHRHRRDRITQRAGDGLRLANIGSGAEACLVGTDDDARPFLRQAKQRAHEFEILELMCYRHAN
jgi:hypothetical protein